MVTQALAGLAMLFATASACFAQSPAAACSVGTEYLPALCPSPLPVLKAVVIEQQASAETGHIACAHFTLSQAQVARFFRQARLIKDENEGRAKLDWLPCASRGKLFFADGQTAQWSISPARSAVVVFESGQRLAMLCLSCRAKPFLAAANK